MTPSLRKLQQHFAAAVYNDAGDGAPAIAAALRDGIFPATRHVQIYRNHTFVTLTAALAVDYPVLYKLVGQGFFHYAADEYIRRHPPRSGCLREFGAAFAEFLSAFPPARPLAYLADVARLEWAWQEAYHAADAQTVTLDALAAVAPERYDSLVFRLHPSARLLASRYPIARIWQTNQDDYSGDDAVDLDGGGEQVLVIRRGIAVEVDALGAGDCALLQAFADGVNIARARDRATAAEPEFDLARALRRHVQSAVVIGFDLP